MLKRWGVAGAIPVLAQRAASEGWKASGQLPFLLAERARSEGARSMRAVGIIPAIPYKVIIRCDLAGRSF
jgi:hypothetical protein